MGRSIASGRALVCVDLAISEDECKMAACNVRDDVDVGELPLNGKWGVITYGGEVGPKTADVLGGNLGRSRR